MMSRVLLLLVQVITNCHGYLRSAIQEFIYFGPFQWTRSCTRSVTVPLADRSFQDPHISGVGGCHCHQFVFRCRRNDEYVTRVSEQQQDQWPRRRQLQNSCYLYFRRGEKAGCVSDAWKAHAHCVNVYPARDNRTVRVRRLPINFFDSRCVKASPVSRLFNACLIRYRLYCIHRAQSAR